MEALRLAPGLTAARLRSHSGDGWLDILAVLSFALSALMALTVAGGVWMFSDWATNPTAHMLQTAEHLGWGQQSDLFTAYFGMAMGAGGLLVFPIFSLGASAARLGARGRAQRLASLRLVGVTGFEAVAMSMVETVVQWIMGAAVGVVAYFATLPLWSSVTFIDQHINPAQMRLPVPLFFAVLAFTLVIALISTAVGLQRVRISPLGVANREPNPALRFWRVGASVAAIAAFVLWTRTDRAPTDMWTYVSMAFMLLIVVGGISLVGPFILQSLARPGTLTRSPAILLATRRILDDPRTAWRNVSAIALLSFIAGFVAAVPFDRSDDGSVSLLHDINTGVLITLAFGFASAALSTLMNQTSLVFDRAPQTYALAQVGFPRQFFGLSRAAQILGPLLLSTLFTTVIGVFLGYSTSALVPSTDSIVLVGVFILIGIGLSVLALLACEPLERHVLANMRRAND